MDKGTGTPTSTSERPTSDLAKDVFAHFGAAYYFAEVLHRGLCNLFVWTRVVPAGTMNRYRVEEHLAKAFSTTLGQLLGEIKTCFSEDELGTLGAAVSKRNYVAHHFWYERVYLMATAEGCRTLIAELEAAEEMFRAADRLVDQVAAPYQAKMGLSSEILEKALQEARSGEPMEPLRSQRKLKKKEVVVRAYEVPSERKGAAIFLETDDGAIWQLCDVGLGWSASDRADPTWQSCPPISEFLPATIDPRPAQRGPWNYELELNGATLVVRPGKPGGPYSFSVRRRK
jgi:hypothetical protein